MLKSIYNDIHPCKLQINKVNLTFPQRDINLGDRIHMIKYQKLYLHESDNSSLCHEGAKTILMEKLSREFVRNANNYEVL